MTNYAYLRTDVRCPYCGTPVTDMLWFQWGFCPGYAPIEKYIYCVNDPIYWKTCKNNTTPAWSHFRDEEGVNIGEPSIKDLIVKDVAQYWLRRTCEVCHQSTIGAAIEIRDGIIKSAWLLKPDELDDDETDIYIIEATGKLQPMPEWNDHPIMAVEDC